MYPLAFALLCLASACDGYRVNAISEHASKQTTHEAVGDSISMHEVSDNRADHGYKPVKVLAVLLGMSSVVAGFQVPHTIATGPGFRSGIRSLGNHSAIGFTDPSLPIASFGHFRSALQRPGVKPAMTLKDNVSIDEILQSDWQATRLSAGQRGTVYAVPGGGVLKHASAAKAGGEWARVQSDMAREWNVLQHLQDRGNHPCVVSGIDARWDDSNFYILMDHVPSVPATKAPPPAALLHEAFTFLETMNWLYTNRVVTHDKAKGNFLHQPNLAGRVWIDMDSDIAPSQPPDSSQLELEGESAFGDCQKHKSSLDLCFQTAFRTKLDNYFGEEIDQKLRFGRGVFNWGRMPTYRGLSAPRPSANYLYKTDGELAQSYRTLRAVWEQLPYEDQDTMWKVIFEDPLLEDWMNADNGIFPREHFWQMVEQLRIAP